MQGILRDGNVKKWILLRGSDKVTFKKVSDIKVKSSAGYISIGFKAYPMRYLKLIIQDAEGGRAIINELEVGKPN